MQDDTKSKLDAFFQAREDEARRRKEAEDKRQREQERNMNAFIECAQTVIEPALMEIRDYLLERGFAAEIKVTKPKDGEKVVGNSHAIEINFPDSKAPGVHEAPHFKFTYNIAEGIVSVWRKTNHSNLPAQRLTSDQITRAWVEEEFAKYFTAGL